jgi:hypothetical protein
VRGKIGADVELNAVAHLLAYLVLDPETANHRMADAGYTGDQIAETLLEARGAGYIEPSGLGVDQLTDLGRARGEEAREQLAEVERKPDLPG